MRFASLFIFLAGFACAADGVKPAPTPALTAQELASPAAPGSLGASLLAAPDGIVWLPWLERRVGGETALRFSTFDATAKKWTPARTIAHEAGWFVNWADFPSLAIGPEGRVTAVWFVKNPATPAAATAHDHHGPGYHAKVSQSTDAGQSWSTPVALTRESTSVEFVSLATLADGRVLAAWLDGRTKQSGGKAQQLYARILGSAEPDVLIDPSVCDCCPTTLTGFLDGSCWKRRKIATARPPRSSCRASRFAARWTSRRRQRAPCA